MSIPTPATRGRAPAARRRRVAAATAVVVLAAGAVAAVALVGAHGNHTGPGPEPPAPTSGPTTGATSPPTTAGVPASPPTTDRSAHPFMALIASYDSLYAAIVALPGVLHGDQGPELHRQMADVLTPDSPLLPTRIEGARPPADYQAADVVQTPGSIRADRLAPGQRNGTYPLYHELLGDLPTPDGRADAATVRACLHMDYRIDRPGAWIETAMDARLPVLVTFHRAGGQWRLHDWQWEPPERQCQRCGPEPVTVANHAAHLNSQPGAPDLIPRQDDPPCT